MTTRLRIVPLVGACDHRVAIEQAHLGTWGVTGASAAYTKLQTSS
jgi:hypothetical protein